MPIAHVPSFRRSSVRRRKRPTILCIDDDPDAVGAIVAALQPFDVRILTDFNGEQGFWEAIRAKPDLIVTDLCMPQGSGEMLIECLRRNPETRSIPVIVVTGRRGGDVWGRVRHLGAARVLKKPFDASALVREIRRFVYLRMKKPPDPGDHAPCTAKRLPPRAS